MTTFKLRKFRAAITSRPTTPAKTIRKSVSHTAAGARPMISETKTAPRPSAHSAQSSASGRPATGNRPVQFGIAVSKKPATTAEP